MSSYFDRDRAGVDLPGGVAALGHARGRGPAETSSRAARTQETQGRVKRSETSPAGAPPPETRYPYSSRKTLRDWMLIEDSVWKRR